MNITTKFLIENGENILKKNRLPDERRNYTISLNEQIKLEKEYLAKFKQCQNFSKENIVTKLPSLNLENLKIENDNRFYNSELMKAISCVTSSLSVVLDDKSLSGSERIRNYIKKLKQIGTDSANGYAMKSNLVNEDEEIDNFFVMKVPKTIESADELVHECMVAFAATNELRKYVPNYSYVYGMIYCSAPYINSVKNDPHFKEVLTWCSTNSDRLAYAIYENIPMKYDMAGYNKLCSAEEFMMYYLQIMFAIREGHKQFGFTHYDLHTENVLLRKTDKQNFYIAYDSAYGTIYLKSKEYISTIIDYGMSHVEEYTDDGRTIHYGLTKKNSYESSGTYRDKSNVLIDVYKFLCFSLSDMLDMNKNRKTFNVISKLLRYFNTKETPEEIIVNQNVGKTWFYMPIVENFDIDDWISYCLKYCKELGFNLIETNKPDNVIGCDKTCKTFFEEMKYIGIEMDGSVSIPKSFFQFYDSLSILIYKENNIYDSGIKKEKEKLLKNFGGVFENVLENEINKMSIEFDSYDKMSDYISYSFPKEYENMFNTEVLSKIKMSMNKYAEIYDAYKTILTYSKVITVIKNLYKVDNTFTKFMNLYDDIKNYEEVFGLKVKKISEKVEQDINFIRSKQDKYKNQVKDTEYEWYFNTLPLLLGTSV